ncbi:flagellar export chaperone FliS [Burkholderia dolosa]|uniref:Flagellar secretion chaperone FliS n=1 Tax=Burkholderia dolosa TaxID=152500 RepID=A0A892IIV8_9BURK|nr:flagellar export chaperone FliS [Burkholderia dolosa]PRE41270.1 flagellar export chaperone FliS [Burkholderia sp. AU12872]PUA76958.1 flagellar export chaperone FliS [Burkholderia sp. AU29985]MBR8420188.1 flagellar export chaperone FliS [Burkholderia dolosa]MBY4658400.1 flagellar export chaperone FliS [Burkholderia dolosa]
MHQQGYENYCASHRDGQTAGASPAQLVVVLMNGLLDELVRVRAHIDAGRYEQKGNGIAKCIAMFAGLTSMLDHDAKVEIVGRLTGLYEYCVRRLNEAGLTLDTALVDEVASLVTTLRDAWAQIDQQHGR